MNKKPFLIKQFPITKISELNGKKSTKTKTKDNFLISKSKHFVAILIFLKCLIVFL